MKLILDSDLRVVGRKSEVDLSKLPKGKYHIVKRVEVLLIGETGSSIHSSYPAQINPGSTLASISSEVLKRQSDRAANNDKYAGRVRYYQGERFVVLNSGAVERLPQQTIEIVDSKPFSGWIIEGKHVWDHSIPEGIDQDLVSEVPENEDKKDKKDKTAKKRTKKKVLDEDGDNVDDLVAYATKVSESADAGDSDSDSFDSDGFLDELSDLTADNTEDNTTDNTADNTEEEKQEESSSEFDPQEELDIDDLLSSEVKILEDSCELLEDNQTLSVVFEGGKYTKKFKSSTVAKNQSVQFREIMKNDKEQAREMLYGSISTFTRVS